MSIPAAFLTARPAASAGGRPGSDTPDDGGTGFGSALQAAVAGAEPGTETAAETPTGVPAEASGGTASPAATIPAVPGFEFPVPGSGPVHLAVPPGGEPGLDPAEAEAEGGGTSDAPTFLPGAAPLSVAPAVPSLAQHGAGPGINGAAVTGAQPGAATALISTAGIAGTAADSDSLIPLPGNQRTAGTGDGTASAGPAAGGTAAAAAIPAQATAVPGGSPLAAQPGPVAGAAQGSNASPAANTEKAANDSPAANAGNTATATAAPEAAAESEPATPHSAPPAPPATPATPVPAAAVPALQVQPSAVQAMAAAPPPAAPAPLLTQVAQPLFSLSSAAPGDHMMTLSVTPENLGPVTVRAHVSADGIRVELFAPNDAGREALRSILTDLRRDLSGSGLSTSLSLSAQDQPGTGPDSRGGTGQELPGSVRAGAASGGEPDAVPAPVQQAFRPVAHGAVSTLDILA